MPTASSVLSRSVLQRAGTCAFAMIAVCSCVASPLTFAQYMQADGEQQQWSISTSGITTSITASGDVLFLFSGVSGLPFSGIQTATFTLSATSTQVGNCGVDCDPGDSFVQPGYSGSFSFIDTGSDPGADLLSGTFAVTTSPATTGAQFSSTVGSTGGSFDASASPANLTEVIFASDFLSFTDQVHDTASWALSSLIPDFTTGSVTADQAYPADTPFNASGAGTFSDPADSIVVDPEPASGWLIGCGLLGLGLLHLPRWRDRVASNG